MSQFNSAKFAFARERITITSGVVKQLTASIYNDTNDGSPEPHSGNNLRKASAARVVLESGSGQIHFTEEGSNPTTGTTGADVGTIASALDVITLDNYQAIVQFKAIALSTNGIAEVVYYR